LLSLQNSDMKELTIACRDIFVTLVLFLLADRINSTYNINEGAKEDKSEL
jgi:hypothetical protein